MAESMMDKSMPPMGQPIMDEEDQDIIVEEEEVGGDEVFKIFLF